MTGKVGKTRRGKSRAPILCLRQKYIGRDVQVEIEWARKPTQGIGITVCLTNKLVYLDLPTHFRSLVSIRKTLSVFTEKNGTKERRGHMQVEEDLGGSLRPPPSIPLGRQIISPGTDTRRFVFVCEYPVGSNP